ncbi:unnamed protein product [Taenia asiatica]|uniref:50S ribosomal protein L34 n=1 Tax=Taenia asiatica TaxID=60517 RepID=A0A0R3VZY7_TAEAS|nr:unnamed protein product [Taenia asiatica]
MIRKRKVGSTTAKGLHRRIQGRKVKAKSSQRHPRV